MNKVKPKATRGVLIWIVIIATLFILINVSNLSTGKTKKIAFSDFMQRLDEKTIQKAKIAGNVITGEMTEEDQTIRYEVNIPLDFPELIPRLTKNGVYIEVEKLNKNEWLSMLLVWGLPILLLFVFAMMFIRQQGGNKAFNFGKSKARMFSGGKIKITFKDVAGVEEAKEELEEIIEFLKEPKKFQRLGGKIPKGVLLIGPPGTGKTLLAKAIAGEANVPFFSISGSDFVELFVGVGASRVRDLFDEGKKHAPCLIFIDEIDAVGRQRGTGMGGGHDEREQTLNQLLVEMDGFDPNEGVIIIAATNRPDILDSALLRPGRFDRRIVVNTPDVKGREEIIKVHTRNTPLHKDVDLKVLARSTPGFTGADIAAMVNEAALFASRIGKKNIEQDDFEYAKDKVLMGKERKSMIISEEEKKITAYHEAGHALIAALDPEADPLHKVSIIPRGMALGVTQQLPLSDKYLYSKTYLEAQISVLLAGRASEEVFLDIQTTGAGSDFQRATSIARKMVCEWGMSFLGPLSLARKDDMIFLGRDMMSHPEYSERTAQLIDEEIKKIIDKIYQKTRQEIIANREKLEAVALQLLERESLSSDDLQTILNGKKTGTPKVTKRSAARGDSGKKSAAEAS